MKLRRPSVRYRCPEGTYDNSPAFQRWVRVERRSSPEGTAETHLGASAVPSGLIGLGLWFPSVKTLGYFQMSLWDKFASRLPAIFAPTQFLVALDILVRSNAFRSSCIHMGSSHHSAAAADKNVRAPTVPAPKEG